MNKLNLFILLMTAAASLPAQALEQNYQGFVASVNEGPSGKVRVAQISQVTKGWYVNVQGDLRSFDFVFPTYADASAFAGDILIGAEVLCSKTTVNTAGGIDCNAFTVSK